MTIVLLLWSSTVFGYQTASLPGSCLLICNSVLTIFKSPFVYPLPPWKLVSSFSRVAHALVFFCSAVRQVLRSCLFFCSSHPGSAVSFVCLCRPCSVSPPLEAEVCPPLGCSPLEVRAWVRGLIPSPQVTNSLLPVQNIQWEGMVAEGNTFQAPWVCVDVYVLCYWKSRVIVI